MALALYRKYRPRTFAEVIGQEHVTEPLMQALRSGRLNHAYLFSGPRGCGKTSSARILARSLNCEKGPTPEPCGECDSRASRWPPTAPARSTSSRSTRPATAASTTPASCASGPSSRRCRSRFKVYVIDEAHMVSSAGFNALLKLVEEPPEYVKFVFATTEPEKVLGTIKSRTHHYPFRLIPPGVLRPVPRAALPAERASASSRRSSRWWCAPAAAAPATRSPCSTSSSPAPGPEGVTYSRRGRAARRHRRRPDRRDVRRARRRRRRGRLRHDRPGRGGRARPAPLRHRPARTPPRPDRAAAGAATPPARA